MPDAYRAVLGILTAFGCVCVAAGGAIALYSAWLVLGLVEDPARVPLVSRLIALGSKELIAFRGSIGEQRFVVELGEPVYWVLLLLAAVLLLALVAGVAKALISVGAGILRPALHELSAQARSTGTPPAPGSRF